MFRNDESTMETKNIGLMDIIRKRRSIRRYKPDPIPENEIRYILEAAREAPSWNNQQCWRFIVVRDKEVQKKLAEASKRRMWMAQAPIIIVACANPSQSGKRRFGGQEYYLVDIGVCVEHMVLAATERGLGTCWIGDFDENSVKRLLGIPGNIRAVALIPVGLPDEEPTPTPRKELQELYTEERWRQ